MGLGFQLFQPHGSSHGRFSAKKRAPQNLWRWEKPHPQLTKWSFPKIPILSPQSSSNLRLGFFFHSKSQAAINFGASPHGVAAGHLRRHIVIAWRRGKRPSVGSQSHLRLATWDEGWIRWLDYPMVQGIYGFNKNPWVYDQTYKCGIGMKMFHISIQWVYYPIGILYCGA